MKIKAWATAMFLTASTASGAAWAQDAEEAAAPEDEEPAAGENAAAEEPTAEEKKAVEEVKADQSNEADVADAARGEGAAELPGVTYRFVGARYRGIIVPKFMQNLFADGGTTVYVHAFGPEFAFRKDGFEYNLGLWLGLYHMDPTAFKGSDDDVIAWEIIESKINVLYFTSDFLWSHDFSPEFALNYGVGAGFGIVFGDLHRNQTYPTNATDPGGNFGDPNDWNKCSGPGQSGTADFCDTDNEHYGDYTEPSWANGGSKPLVFPWLALQTGLRYKFSRRFVSRLDLGFGTSGFFFGIGADYGL